QGRCYPSCRPPANAGCACPFAWLSHLEQREQTPMKPAWLLVVGLAAAPLATSGFAQQMDFNKVQIITDQMAPNLYMLSGSGGLDPSHDDAAGGRIGVLAGPDGILMVDSQYAQ